MNNDKKHPTAWESFSGWYQDLVGTQGHYYHQKIVLPGVLKLLNLKSQQSLLDLACGQGILGRFVSKDISYVGIDASAPLIKEAQKLCPHRKFICADVTSTLPLQKKDFDAVTVLLALQNIENCERVFKVASAHLKKGGQFLIVLNHPCFRIPRQSSWEIDDTQKMQYRRLNRYFTPMKIPMQVHPGKGKQSPTMWAFHEPLSYYTNACTQAGFVITQMEEWVSDKTSVGKAAKMENRARKEFPLFLALLAKKQL